MNNKIILFFLMILVSIVSVSATVTYNVTNYADRTEISTTSAVFNITPVSTSNNNITSYFYLSKVNNNTIIANETVQCVNNTACVISKTLSLGYYKWYIAFNDTSGNTSLFPRWLEVRNGTYVTDWFKWVNDANTFVAMKLNKNTGELDVTGNVTIHGNLSVLGVTTFINTTYYNNSVYLNMNVSNVLRVYGSAIFNRTVINNAPVACSVASGYAMSFFNGSNSICPAIAAVPSNLQVNGNLTLSKNSMLKLNNTIYPACSTTHEGKFVYNYTLKKALVCNSTSWVSLW